MPFGLKNAPSEFQKIMNDIFNPFQDFSIVYVDDILIFSQNIDQHFKHLQTFFTTAKRSGVVVSKPKIKLFQTKIRFFLFEIHLGLIKSIQRSIEFASNFLDQITDKTQLQRFLGCLSYVSDFVQNTDPFASHFLKAQKESKALD